MGHKSSGSKGNKGGFQEFLCPQEEVGEEGGKRYKIWRISWGVELTLSWGVRGELGWN